MPVITIFFSICPFIFDEFPKLYDDQSVSEEFVDLVNSVLIFAFGAVLSTILDKWERRLHLKDTIDTEIIPSIEQALFAHDRGAALAESKDLSNGQRAMKSLLWDELRSRNSRRFLSLHYNNWINFYDFGVIFDPLYKTALSSGGKSGVMKGDNRKHRPVMRDYTVSYNADKFFRSYSFKKYFEDVMSIRRSYRNCGVQIRFLVFVDILPPYIVSKDGEAPPDSLDREKARSAAIHFERSLAVMLKEFRRRYMKNAGSPNEVYAQVAAESNNMTFGVRLITKNIFDRFGNDRMARDIDQPFNVYGDLAVSRSVVRHFENENTPPVPHVRASVNPSDIEKYRNYFDQMWSKSGDDVRLFFEEDDDWEVFGTGELVERWRDLR